MKKALFGFLFTFLFSGILQAQEDKLGAWYIYNGFFKFTPKWELFFETQLRNYEVFSHPDSYFFKPYITYNVLDDLQFGVSAEYHVQYDYAEIASDQTYKEEFRVALQGILGQEIGRVNIQHRYRYEFRYINSTGGNRMRYRIQLTIPINGEKVEKGIFFFTANNEFFINNQPAWEFDQNRLYLAAGWQFSKTLNFQLGYLLRSDATGNYNKLQIFLTQKLDFSKNDNP